MDAAIARCGREQAAIGDAIRAGSEDPFGARLGAQDWLKEEAVLSQGRSAFPPGGNEQEGERPGRV